jgi:hypothetical protein
MVHWRLEEKGFMLYFVALTKSSILRQGMERGCVLLDRVKG